MINRIREAGSSLASIGFFLAAALVVPKLYQYDGEAQLTIIKSGTPEVARLTTGDEISVDSIRCGLDENEDGILSDSERAKALRLATTLDKKYRASSVAPVISRTIRDVISH